jgi:hypothetical protein
LQGSAEGGLAPPWGYRKAQSPIWGKLLPTLTSSLLWQDYHDAPLRCVRHLHYWTSDKNAAVGFTLVVLATF